MDRYYKNWSAKALDHFRDVIVKAIEVDRSTRKTEAGALDSVFEHVRHMIAQGYVHKTKGYRLKDMSARDQWHHLNDEIQELDSARTTEECRQELADVLGVLFHMAIYAGDTPQALATRLNNKLRERFDCKVQVGPERYESRIRELEDLIRAKDECIAKLEAITGCATAPTLPAVQTHPMRHHR